MSQDFKPAFPVHEVGVSTIRLRPLTAKDRILAHVGNRTTLFKPVAKHSCHSTGTEVFYARVPILVSRDFREYKGVSNPFKQTLFIFIAKIQFVINVSVLCSK